MLGDNSWCSVVGRIACSNLHIWSRNIFLNERQISHLLQLWIIQSIRFIWLILLSPEVKFCGLSVSDADGLASERNYFILQWLQTHSWRGKILIKVCWSEKIFLQQNLTFSQDSYLLIYRPMKRNHYFYLIFLFLMGFVTIKYQIYIVSQMWYISKNLYGCNTFCSLMLKVFSTDLPIKCYNFYWHY